MGRGCCGGGCGCALAEGSGVTIEGSGTLSDPFVISADINLEPDDSSVFDVSISGTGSPGSPYQVAVDFAGTASVRDLPDWSGTLPTNGQVPVWNSTTQEYEPGSNTPAATGSVSHDDSLDGDGSPGDILAVIHDPDRYTETTVDGIGLTEAGINRLVRRFADSTTRAAADPVPELNSVSVLDTEPGKVDYWSGSEWKPVEEVPSFSGAALLELSGTYTAGNRVARLVRRVTVTTDSSGGFTALSSANLAGLAGVLSASVQELGAVPFKVMLTTSAGQVLGTAYRLDTGAAYPAQPIDLIVEAIVYT